MADEAVAVEECGQNGHSFGSIPVGDAGWIGFEGTNDGRLNRVAEGWPPREYAKFVLDLTLRLSHGPHRS